MSQKNLNIISLEEENLLFKDNQDDIQYNRSTIIIEKSLENLQPEDQLKKSINFNQDQFEIGLIDQKDNNNNQFDLNKLNQTTSTIPPRKKTSSRSRSIHSNPLSLNDEKRPETINTHQDNKLEIKANTQVDKTKEEEQQQEEEKSLKDHESTNNNNKGNSDSPQNNSTNIAQLLLAKIKQVNNENQPKFKQGETKDMDNGIIVDVIAEYQRGNFLPVLDCLRKNLIPKDWLDQSGYSLIHHAVSYNLPEITLILINIFKVNANLPSRSSQTPLMIACNFGFNEIIKLLCDHGCNLDLQDDSQFTALLYAVKQNSFPAFIYLLYKKCDTTIIDANGCSIVHWAAYKNNLFMLKLLKRLNFDIWVKDGSGFNGFERAASSDALAICKFFVEDAKDVYPTRWKVEEVINPAIKELLRRHYQKTRYEIIIDKVKQFFLKHQRIISFLVYLTLWVLNMLGYYRCVELNGFEYIYHIVYISFGIYNILYSIWYFIHANKNSSNRNNHYRRIGSINPSELYELSSKRTIDPNIIKNMNFHTLNKLTNESHEGLIVGEQVEDNDYIFPTFLHEIAYLFESNNFNEINTFDHKDYCPICLKIKPNRSKHCKRCNQCVEQYHFHSFMLGKCIDKASHMYYLVFLVQSVLLIGLTLIPPIIIYNNKRESRLALFYFETAWLIGLNEGIIYGLWYLINGILYLYSLCFLFIELYGISLNLTHYEIFNRHKCKYLFDLITTKDERIINSYKNPFDKGFLSNWAEYLGRLFE